MRRFLLLGLIIFAAVIFWWQNVVRPSPAPAIPAAPSPTAAPASSFYTFAVISDIHSDDDGLQRSLDQARADGVGFIIITGDLTTVGGEKELKRVKSILDASGLAYYVIPGNHDLWSRGVANFIEVFGVDFQSFQKSKIKFILINNADGNRGINGAQQNWLDEELVDCLKLYCLVFAHMPLNHPYLAHIMGEDSAVVASQAAWLVKKLTSYQVKKLFAGHVHYFSSYELEGLKTHTAGAIYSEKDTVPPRFLEITVSAGPQITLEEKEVWVE